MNVKYLSHRHLRINAPSLSDVMLQYEYGPPDGNGSILLKYPKSDLLENNWYLVTIVYDGNTERAHFYLNGSETISDNKDIAICR